MQFGKFNIELRNFKLVTGHDDSLPFTGDMYINNQKVASCYNNGWGGECNIHVMPESMELFKEAERVVESTIWFDENNNYYNMSTPTYYNMPALVDEMANEMAEKIEVQKVIKREQGRNLIIQKDCANNMGEIYKIVVVKKGWTIESALKRDSKFVAFLKEVIEKKKQNGFKILNTNIPTDIL